MSQIKLPKMQLYNQIRLDIKIGKSYTTGSSTLPIFNQEYIDNGSYIYSNNVISGESVNFIYFESSVQNVYLNIPSAICLYNPTDSDKIVSIDSKYNGFNAFNFKIFENTIENPSSVWTRVGDFNINSISDITVKAGKKIAVVYVDSYSGESDTVSFNFFYDATTPEFTAKCITLDELLTDMCGADGYNYVRRDFEVTNGINYVFLSGDMICGYPDAVMTSKQLTLLKEFCAINAYNFYFDENEIMQVLPQEKRINETIHELENIEDLIFRYDDDIRLAGVNIGYNSQSVNYPLFRQQFAEKLTYRPENVPGNKILNLVCDKLRVDYAGLLLTRYEFENSNKQGDTSKRYKDIWMVQIDETQTPFVPMTNGVSTNLEGGGEFNVYLSPQRMLRRWLSYLSGAFGVFNNNAMVLSAQENTENKMISTIEWTGADDLNLNEKEPVVNLLQNYPFVGIQCQFQTLYEMIDIYAFEKIKFNHKGKNYEAIIKDVQTSVNNVEALEITALLTHKIPV